ncbi:predicted protein [Pyrenophora tritici-repentis Pt-1C-BFP]|uniref:Ketoreductase domain-containing protein n=1 Tax=Pyrenophora tritici-repentis (strain Pt-1C-BFP) TaxID=426418 RepID=B2W9D2_PYRTR|nr:uncharacterized protein PTRG_06590 [Pyrenophora tritici-repentis Pt-1C-BFP]EDU49510.1 predicted protein [Pyrenophora tritici-repentis Pt-1C-BFP]
MDGMDEHDPGVCSGKEQQPSSASSDDLTTAGLSCGTAEGLIDSLMYRLAWFAAPLSETPLPMRSAVVISADTSILENYVKDLKPLAHRVLTISTSKEIKDYTVVSTLAQDDAVVIYAPAKAEKNGDVASRNFARYSLYGFARAAASEHSDTWGGLIDNEGAALPLSSIRDVRMQGVVRVQNGVPQVARLRQFSASEKAKKPGKSLLPRPGGTYLVTGSFEKLDLEVLQFLVERGAQRIVVVSRHTLPPRKEWPSVFGPMSSIIERIKLLEDRGATIHALALDIGLPGASSKLTSAIEQLSLPPVLGVVHAAAVPEHGYIKDTTSDTYATVMAPKITRALNLHETFPPGTLDFLILFSSINQVIGTPGQSASAASNTFLDGLAIHRRKQYCNTVAIQSTAWRASVTVWGLSCSRNSHL